ncbi:uncharacterized protein LOC112686241 [Sipha flava]|jgi:hypothetical protein|uniref:Uncharacterized protein LOC112686241 n=1 Tax=Sipha flava TaxID=143950 RepID=A0A8B8FTW1_9HEMI|nr:uncharacterized protein LOC112686241 [Sipha flava]
MDDRRYDTKEQRFLHELVQDIYDDIYNNHSDDPTKVYLTITEHLNNVNGRVPDPFTAEELVEIEQSLKDAVRDLTDNDINTYLCSGIVVLSEYLDTPEDILDYVGRPRNNSS